MSIQMREEKPSVDSVVLSELQTRLNIRLPTSYVEFLLKHNGGRPSPQRFRYKLETGPYTDSLVDWFYGVHSGQYNNFEKMYRLLKVRQQRLPENLVAIATDPFGNEICLSVKGDDEGKVYFWDHEEERGGASYANCHLIADTFDEFVAGLH